MQLNKSFQLSLLVLIVISLLCSSAYAGTLTSGSTVAITSNNNEVSGKYNLVGTWSTTPTAADSIIITNSQLPDPYGIKSQLVIDVPQPTFAQVFSVQSQKPIYTYALWSSDLYFFSDYQNKIDAQFAKEHPNAVVIVDKISCGALNCNGYKVYASSQLGWVGSVVNSGINYDQNINIQGVGTINLASNKITSQLSGSIPGVAIARLLGFSSWTNALLSDKNVYAFHAGTSTSVGSWKPFSDDGQYYTSYISTETALKNVLNTGGTCVLNSCFTSKFNSAIASANTQSQILVGASSNYPSQWNANSNKAGVTSTSNNINVPLSTTVLTANIQLVLNGDKIGLFIATGVPAIYSIDKSVTFSEINSANINYVAQNLGQSDGSFQTSLSCPSGKITGQADQFTLGAGEKLKKQMYVTAKTNANSDLSDTCTFTLTESTTGAKVSQQVTVNVQAKANCAAGQQSDPYTSGTLTVVDTYDSSCKVVSQIKCTTATQTAQLNNGVYECVNKPSTPGSGATNFNVWLFASALIMGAIVAGFTYSYVKVFSFGKFGKVAVPIIVFVAFIAGIMLTVYLVNAFIGYFSV